MWNIHQEEREQISAHAGPETHSLPHQDYFFLHIKLVSRSQHAVLFFFIIWFHTQGILKMSNTLKKKAPASLIESEESSSACRRVLTPAAARCFGEVIYAEKRPPRTAGNQIQERFICVSTNQVHMYEIKRVKGYQADLRPAEDSGKIPQLSRFITSSRESSVGAVCSLLSFSDQVSDLWLFAVCVFNMLSVFSVFEEPFSVLKQTLPSTPCPTSFCLQDLNSGDFTPLWNHFALA